MSYPQSVVTKNIYEASFLLCHFRSRKTMSNTIPRTKLVRALLQQKCRALLKTNLQMRMPIVYESTADLCLITNQRIRRS